MLCVCDCLFSEYHLFDWGHKDALRSELLELADDFPEALLVENSMNGAPLLVGQRYDGRTLDARQNIGDVCNLILWCIHHYVFLVLC